MFPTVMFFVDENKILSLKNKTKSIDKKMKTELILLFKFRNETKKKRENTKNFFSSERINFLFFNDNQKRFEILPFLNRVSQNRSEFEILNENKENFRFFFLFFNFTVEILDPKSFC